jgi:hypothetical protein
MAKHITVRGAQPHTKEQEPERVYITINGCFPYSITEEDLIETREGFKEDAERVFIALQSLPGGTFCQLLVLMLQEKASQFIVSHKPTAEYRKMEAASEMFTACEAALNGLEYIGNSHPNTTGKAQRAEAIDLLRKALTKARGEKEGQDG